MKKRRAEIDHVMNTLYPAIANDIKLAGTEYRNTLTESVQYARSQVLYSNFAFSLLFIGYLQVGSIEFYGYEAREQLQGRQA